MLRTNIILSLVILGLVEAAHIPQNYSSFNKRILNGENVDIKDAKFFTFFICSNVACGATLVSPTRVITAAHCVVNCNVNDAKLYMGMNSRDDINSGRADIYKASNLYLYPDYNQKPNKFYYDVAVFYINGVVRQTDKVAPIAVSAEKPNLGINISCYGYGATSVGGPGSNNLKKAVMKTTRYENNLIATDARQNSVLPGDSGGPCVYNNKFIGDISGLVQDSNGNPTENLATLSSAPEISNFLRSHGINF
ncbi:trypsin-like [Onthophagus taurus]|uniref:trypsin-like n=1 Tax=Onthophagus taurus TaxID=166361 RepID=UPI0039BDB154